MGIRIKTKQIKDFSTDVETIAQNTSTYASAGVMYPPPVLTDNGNGSINLTSCDVSIRYDENHATALHKHQVDAVTNLVLNDNAVNYIVIKHVGMGAQYDIVAEENVGDINESNIIPVYTCSRDGVLIIVLGWDSLGSGLSNKLHARFVKTDRFGHESGLYVSEKNVREVAITEGVIWNGGIRSPLNAVDSTIDDFMFWRKIGGNWENTLSTTQYNNSQYQGATDLISLTPGYYTVNWIMRAGNDNIFGYMLGENEYETLGDAQNADVTDLPYFRPQGFMVGRIIVKQGEDTGIVQSSFIVTFPTTLLSNHSYLSGLGLDSHPGYTLLNGRSGDILNIDTIQEFTTSNGVSISSQLSLGQGASTTTDLSVGTTLAVTEKITIGNESGTPGDAVAGDIVWDGTNFKGFNGTEYKILDSVPTVSTVQTTDATETLLGTITGMPNSASSLVKIYIKALSTDDSEWGTWVRTLTITKTGGGLATIRDETSSADATSAGLGVGSVDFVVSSGDVNVNVTGTATDTINWTSSYEIH